MRRPPGKRGAWVVLALGPLCLFGCDVRGVRGNGVSKTETRQLAEFDRVAFEGVGLVRITCGPPQSVSVTSDENLLVLVDTRVIDGRLTIEPLEPLRPRTELTVDITLPSCAAIELVGYPTFEVAGIDSESFGVSIRGNGRVILLGSSDHLNVSVVGYGVVRAVDFEARGAEVSVLGNGDVELRAVEELSVVIEGDGHVAYAGEPRLTVEHPGVGTIDSIAAR